MVFKALQLGSWILWGVLLFLVWPMISKLVMANPIIIAIGLFAIIFVGMKK